MTVSSLGCFKYENVTWLRALAPGTLLSPEPPAAEIAQVQSYNTHLAKQAYINLAKLSGRPAAVPAAKRQEDDSDGASQVERRAARPQGVPAIKEVDDVLPKFLHLAADPNGSKEEEQVPNPAFPYGSVPIRGVNLGGWLVREFCRKTSITHAEVPFLQSSLGLPHLFSRRLVTQRWWTNTPMASTMDR